MEIKILDIYHVDCSLMTALMRNTCVYMYYLIVHAYNDVQHDCYFSPFVAMVFIFISMKKFSYVFIGIYQNNII